jgi:DNA gyrase inhibitor GyrI
MNNFFITATVATGAAAIFAACAGTRGGYESASYRVVKSEDEFELRDYPTLAIVQTPMRGADDSFMRLFRYIDGQNVATQKIAMTTPVFMTGGATNAAMSFVMPKTMPVDQVPQPNHPNLTVTTIPAGQFAVMRFRGGRTSQNESNALATLTARLQEKNLAPTGDPIFAYFDPPWTPIPMRRNEVMLRIASP